MAKRVLRVFTGMAAEKNAADLDRLSRQGSQLQKPGAALYEFAPGAAPQRHVLDYCPLLLGEKETKRRQTAFEEAGWTLIGATHAGWYFYRRPADEALPEAAYENPCPRPQAEKKQIGLIGILGLLRVLVLLAGAVLAVVAMFRGEQMVFPAVIFLLLILLLSFKIQGIQQRLKP